MNCLVCLGKIMEFLDKFLVIDEIFPLLLEIPTREPAICMAMLGKEKGQFCVVMECHEHGHRLRRETGMDGLDFKTSPVV